jgi:hypothetical protein
MYSRSSWWHDYVHHSTTVAPLGSLLCRKLPAREEWGHYYYTSDVNTVVVGGIFKRPGGSIGFVQVAAAAGVGSR